MRRKIRILQGEYMGDELIVRKGLLESDAELKVDDIVQFERFGFVRIDEVGEKVVAIFAHK